MKGQVRSTTGTTSDCDLEDRLWPKTHDSIDTGRVLATTEDL